MNDDLRDVLAAFKCHGCGNCCRGAGVVRVTDDRLRMIAGHLGLDTQQTAETYFLPGARVGGVMARMGLSLRQAAQMLKTSPMEAYRQPDGTFHLISKNNATQDCVFLDNGRCLIHPVKPEQCSEFPYTWRNDDSFETCQGLRAAVRTSSEKTNADD